MRLFNKITHIYIQTISSLWVAQNRVWALKFLDSILGEFYFLCIYWETY